MSAGEPRPRFLTAGDISGLISRPADLVAAYGSEPAQFGELRLPPGAGPQPMAVVIHGGCWLARYANLGYTAALADGLRAAGLATWNIEYRCLDQSGGGWPGTLLDVGAAADWLRQLAGPQWLDLRRVITIPIDWLPLGIRQVFVTGQHDYVVAPADGDAYITAASRQDDQARHLIVPGVAHHEYNQPGSTAWSMVLAAVRWALAG